MVTNRGADEWMMGGRMKWGGEIKRGMEGERAGYSDQSVPKTGRDMKNDK